MVHTVKYTIQLVSYPVLPKADCLPREILKFISPGPFLSFGTKLRKRRRNPGNPVNPVEKNKK